MTQCHWDIRSLLCEVTLCHHLWSIGPKFLRYDTMSLGNAFPTFRSNVFSHLQGSKHSRIYGTFGISSLEDEDKQFLRNLRSLILVLFPTTAQRLDFALLHVSATYCSHHQGAYYKDQAAYHMSANLNMYTLALYNSHLKYGITKNCCLIVVCCLFSLRHNPLWLYFHSPVADFSLLVFEVS